MKYNAIRSALYGLLCLSAMTWLAGCENDEPASPPTDWSLMTEHEFGNNKSTPDLSVLYNGEEPYMRVAFRPWSEDGTKMEMVMMMGWNDFEKDYPIGVYLPRLILDPVQGVGTVTFEGEATEAGNYVRVQGQYEEATDYLNLSVVSELAIPELSDREYIFRFGSDCLELKQAPSRGDDYDFVQTMLQQMGERLGEAYDEMKFVFHNDYTYEWLIKPTGEADYRLLSASKFWPRVDMDQLLMFHLGGPDIDGNPAFSAEERIYEAFVGDVSALTYAPAFAAGNYFSASYEFDGDGRLALSLNPYSFTSLGWMAYELAKATHSMTDEQLADMKRFIELTNYSFFEGVYDTTKSDWVIVHSSDEARDI